MKSTRAAGVIFSALVIFLFLTFDFRVMAADQTVWAVLIVSADDTDWNVRKKETQLVDAIAAEFKLAKISDDQVWLTAYHFNKPSEKQICTAPPLNLKKDDLPYVGIAKAKVVDGNLGEFIEVRKGFKKVEADQAHDIIDWALRALGSPRKGTLEVTSDPPEAEVFVGDAEKQKIGTTPLSYDGLDWGSAQITVRKKFYSESTFKVAINPGRSTKAAPVKLDRLPAGLLIACSGGQTGVLVDVQKIYERIIRENPEMAELMPLMPRQVLGSAGTRLLDDLGAGEGDLPLLAVVTQKEHNPVDQVSMWKRVDDASAAMGKAIESAGSFLGRTIKIPDSTIDVVTDPREATIIIDGSPVGRGTLKGHRLGWGKHTLDVAGENFVKQSQTFRLLLGEHLSLSVSLKAAPKPVIDVVMEPRDAVVRIDGKKVSTGPIYNYEVAPGTHEVDITKENHTREHRAKKLESGEHWSITGVTLAPVPVAVLIAHDGGGAAGALLEKYYRKFVETNQRVLGDQVVPLVLLDTSRGADRQKAGDAGIESGSLPLISVIDRSIASQPARLIWKSERVADPVDAIQRAMEFVAKHLSIDVQPPVSRVDIMTRVGDATLVLDGRATLQAPLIGYEIAPGRHTVELRKEKYLPLKEEFTVEYGDYSRHTYTLLEEKGGLAVRAVTEDGADLPDAELSVDGRQVAVLKGAEASIELETGTHDILVRKSGFDDYTEKVAVEGGKSKSVIAKMKRKILTVLGRMSAQGAQITQGDMIVANVDVRTDKMKSLIVERFKSLGATRFLWESEEGDYGKIDLFMRVAMEISMESPNGECIVTVTLKPVDAGKVRQKLEPIVRRKALPGNTPATLMETKANQVLEGLLNEILPEVEGILKSW